MKKIFTFLIIALMVFIIILLFLCNKHSNENTFKIGRLITPWSLWNEKLSGFYVGDCSNFSCDVENNRLRGVTVRYENAHIEKIKNSLIEQFGPPRIDEDNVTVWRLNDYGTAMQLSLSDDNEIVLILLPLQ